MRAHLRVVLIAITLGASGAPRAVAAPGFDPDAIYDVPLDDAARRGPDDALVTIVEFSDFACGYCNRMQPVLKHLERLYPGQLRYVFRPMPLDEDDGALASEAAIAAGRQGRFCRGGRGQPCTSQAETTRRGCCPCPTLGVRRCCSSS